MKLNDMTGGDSLRKMSLQGDLFGHDVRYEIINYDEHPHLARVKGKVSVAVLCVNDICGVLGGKPEARLRNVPGNEKFPRTMFASGQRRKLWFVTNQGLYRLVFASRHPNAEKFRDWLNYDVMAAIEAGGKYAESPAVTE